MELAGGRIVFGPPKTAAGRRTVAVPVELVELLEEHLAEYVGPEAEALVFTSPEGHPLRRTSSGPGAWTRAVKRRSSGCTSTTCAGAVRRGGGDGAGVDVSSRAHDADDGAPVSARDPRA